MKQRGFTVVELIIAMGLFSILGIIIVQFTRNSYSTFLRGQISSTIHDESTSVTSRLSNALRGTYQVQTATNSTLTVLTYFAPTDITPTQLTIQQSGNAINLTIIQGVASNGSYTFDPNTARTKSITNHFVTSVGTTSLLLYYDESGTSLTSPVTVSAVHLIEVTTTIFSQIDHTKTAQSSTKVELRNLKTNL